MLVVFLEVKASRINFSVKEKDEARVPTVSGLRNAFILVLPGDEGPLHLSALVSCSTALSAKLVDQMLKKTISGLALASAVINPSTHAASYADAVVNYSSGSGFAPGYTNPTAALGEPSRVTPGQFGGPVDPFNPPYLAEQLVSVGASGSLTLGFSSPIPNDPANPFGIDFMVYGDSGFIITNGNYTGGGITDGSLFAANTGSTRVSVSSDGSSFYELSPSLAPTVDSFFPTDGSGNFSTAVNPSLTGASFAGKGLASIRQLYGGAAGGAGFDISWARNSSGQPVNLDSVRFVRIDVLSGVSEIDGVSVVPEPGSVPLFLSGGMLLLALRRLS